MTTEYKPVIERVAGTLEMAGMQPVDMGLDDPFIQDLLEKSSESRKMVITAMNKDPGIRRMSIANFACMADYYKILRDARQNGQKVVWVPFTFAPEILWAMDLVPVTVESMSTLAQTLPEGPEVYIDLCHERGLPETLCSSHKGAIGMLEAGVVEKPDLLISAALGSCDPNSVAFEYIAKKWDIPTLYLDIPYHNDARSLEYFTKGYKKMIAALEEMTGHKLDQDRLREAVELANQANEIDNEINILKRHIPNPVPNYYTGYHLGIRLSHLGTQRAVDFMKVALEVCKERFNEGKSVAPEEKVRYMNMYTNLYTDVTLQPWFQEVIGVTYLTDFLDWYGYSPYIDTSSYDKMIEGLAEELFKVPMSRQMKTGWDEPGGWGPDMLHYVDIFKPDCLVFTGHVACKHAWGSYRLVADFMKKETGLPCLRLEADGWDPRITPMSVVREQLLDFFETLN